MNDLNQLQILLQNRVGLHFAPEKHIDLVTGAQQAMADAGYTHIDDYCYALTHESLESPLWRALIRQLTVGETYFFRDAWQFRALREEILPDLIERRRQANQFNIRVWSAGCASGEETYSLAMLFHELLPDIERWNISILGTDINETALEKARAATYGQWSFRIETPLALRDKYFFQQGDLFELSLDVRSMCEFAFLNLADNSYPSTWNNTHNLDLIVCRNVTIYFDRQTTQAIVNRFHQALNDGGWLVVGHSEPLPSIYKAFEFHTFPNAVLYRKSGPTTAALSHKPESSPIKALPDATRRPAAQLSDDEQRQRLAEIDHLLNARNLEGARRLLNSMLEMMPQNLDALFLLAKLSADEGQLEWVHQILDTIEELNPLMPQAHYLRAMLYQQSAAWEDAKSALRRALYVDREFALAHYYMGELLYTEGKLPMARRSWQKALEVLQKYAIADPVPHGDGVLAGTLVHAIEQRLNQL